ncbi:MAG: hypothetical protein R2719_08915 [Micropruina sp.]
MFSSWLLLVRGELRRAPARAGCRCEATGAWDLTALHNRGTPRR